MLLTLVVLLVGAGAAEALGARRERLGAMAALRAGDEASPSSALSSSSATPSTKFTALLFEPPRPASETLASRMLSLLRSASFFIAALVLGVLNLPDVARAVATAVSVVVCLRDPRSLEVVRYTSFVVAYLVSFHGQKEVPAELRPPVVADVLPAWDRQLLNARPAPPRHRPAHRGAASRPVRRGAARTRSSPPRATRPWTPSPPGGAGILHYLSPFVFILWLYRVNRPALKARPPPPRPAPRYLGPTRGQLAVRAFGCMNLASVGVQFLFPTAPPWTRDLFGPGAELSYDTPGYAAGLLRFDEVLHAALGLRLFGPMFESSPLVFGSWPSMHCAWPLFFALFGGAVRRASLLLFLPHTLWVAWAVMYLKHHWLVDVLGGFGAALATYLLARPAYLPAARLRPRSRAARDAGFEPLASCGSAPVAPAEGARAEGRRAAPRRPLGGILRRAAALLARRRPAPPRPSVAAEAPGVRDGGRTGRRRTFPTPRGTSSARRAPPVRPAPPGPAAPRGAMKARQARGAGAEGLGAGQGPPEPGCGGCRTPSGRTAGTGLEMRALPAAPPRPGPARLPAPPAPAPRPRHPR
eukprot:tig00001065_g6746.t1